VLGSLVWCSALGRSALLDLLCGELVHSSRAGLGGRCLLEGWAVFGTADSPTSDEVFD